VKSQTKKIEKRKEIEKLTKRNKPINQQELKGYRHKTQNTPPNIKPNFKAKKHAASQPSRVNHKNKETRSYS
jgi:hypothetical protein